ncbi:MAG: peptidylprolyl isomerase, partial [Cytophagaceae bacterium]
MIPVASIALLEYFLIDIGATKLKERTQLGTLKYVKFRTTAGEFVLELYPDKAPVTVDNFLQYVREKHYENTLFHRVIPNFMIQGGGVGLNYVDKPTRAPIPHEGRLALSRGGPRNLGGTVGMARASDPNSATAQFFINLKDNKDLDAVLIPDSDPVPRFEHRGRVYENVRRSDLLSSSALFGYTVFGKVVSGMDVVHKIE